MLPIFRILFKQCYSKLQISNLYIKYRAFLYRIFSQVLEIYKESKTMPFYITFELSRYTHSVITRLNLLHFFPIYFLLFFSKTSPLSDVCCRISFYLPSNCSVSPDDIYSALRLTDSNGPDGISSRLLYNYRLSLFLPIYFLFRYSMDSGIFASVWKIYSVTTILKSGDPS